ncbi:CBL-interacting protein kinase 22-like [Panicum miliaceum]|uniref:non-specific serine/threonine protein kinase n=1 Tax=Panicum miliaceum TaxID=4540 RepID=A0A3L6R9W4_PANMI|nr:CBL-interacting protein kinase 22-like [Panicum miliaceum]
MGRGGQFTYTPTAALRRVQGHPHVVRLLDVFASRTTVYLVLDLARGGSPDVWSCGVVLFSLTAVYLPFNDGNLMGMYCKICSGRFRCPKWFSLDLRSLIGRMLDPEPNTRIKVGEILGHPWLHKDGMPFPITPTASSHPTPEVVKWEAKLELAREMNAFDILTFTSGCDLSGLIETLTDRVRFVVSGINAKSVLDKVEELGREEGFAVRRKEEEGFEGVL